MKDDEWTSLARYLLAGCVVAIGVALLFAGWLAITSVGRDLVVMGVVVERQTSRTLLCGRVGVFQKFVVSNGDHVAAGDLVARLTDSVLDMRLQATRRQTLELVIRQHRLRAERAGDVQLSLPPDAEISRGDRALVDDLLKLERDLFDARRQTIKNLEEESSRRIGHVRREVDGYSRQLKAKNAQLLVLRKQIEMLEGAQDPSETVPFEVGRSSGSPRVTKASQVWSLKREEARIESEIGALLAAIARARGKISELEALQEQRRQEQRRGLTQDLQQVGIQLVRAQEAEAVVRAAVRQLDVRAPIGGTVRGVMAHEAGARMQVDTRLLEIVPDEGGVYISVTVPPSDLASALSSSRVRVGFGGRASYSRLERVGQLVGVSADYSGVRLEHHATCMFGLRLINQMLRRTSPVLAHVHRSRS